MSCSPPNKRSKTIGAGDSAAADLYPNANPPSSLVSACYASLTTAPLDHARLEQLPQHMLVQLLTQAVAERDQERAVRQQQEQELAAIAEEKQHHYVVDLPYVTDRVDGDMYKRVKAVTAKWAPCRKHDDFTAHQSINNYHPERLLYNIETKAFSFQPPAWATSAEDGPYRQMFQVMSSALLLYRICCMFHELHIEVDGPPGYKYVWSAEVQHVATGEAVGFSEWKGGALARVSSLEGPQEFPDDMLELLNLLFDERCPHPYDGVVAGCVA